MNGYATSTDGKDEIEIKEYEPIDLRTLAIKAMPSFGKLIPRFLFRKIGKILHLDEINGFLGQTYNLPPEEFLSRAKEFLNINLQIEGYGKIEALKGQGVMFVSNHPYGGPEALILMEKLIRDFPDVKLLAQSLFSFIRPMKGCCVYNHGELKTLQTAAREGVSMLFYPAGFCSRRLGNGEIFDYDWKSTFFSIARRNNFPIVPIYVDGSLSPRIHRLTAFRKFFHIKFTFETLYLVDEMFRLRNQTLRMTVGDPILPDCFDTELSRDDCSARIRQYCHDLRTDIHARFDSTAVPTLPEK